MTTGSDILLIAAAALILAALVYLMYKAATAPEWTELSQKEKAEMRKAEAQKKKR